MIRVLVAASSAIARAGLEALVRADARFTVVSDGLRHGDLGVQVRESRPDAVLAEAIDASALPRLANLTQQPAAPAVVLLADGLSRSELRRALQSGIRGVLARDADAEEITAALVAVTAGLAALSPDYLDQLLPAADVPDGAFLPGEPLTARESEVLALMAEGAGNKEIATRLTISEHTVKFHVSSILAKLGAATRTEAVARGAREGLIML